MCLTAYTGGIWELHRLARAPKKDCFQEWSLQAVDARRVCYAAAYDAAVCAMYTTGFEATAQAPGGCNPT